MKISVSASGLQTVRQRTVFYLGRLRNLAPAFSLAAVEVLDDAQMQFNNEGDPPWAPKKRDNGLPLLVRRGTLKQSLQADEGENIERIEGGIRVGTNVEYAAVQQFGSSSRNIPARPFLWRDGDALARKIRDVFARHLASTEA